MSIISNQRTLKDSLVSLNEEQKEQILRQIQFHIESPPYENIQLNCLISLQLNILPNVTRPMSSKGIAKWLWSRPDLYRHKKVLDIGTGCGIQGIVCLLGGAELATLTDISKPSVDCAKINLDKIGFQKRSIVQQSDLFNSLKDIDRYDLIIFAQPYFSGKPIDNFEFTIGMFDSENLQHRFFKEVGNFLNTNGCIVLMSWKFAGDSNDPALIAPIYGFEIERIDNYYDWTGVQQGEFEILLLKKNSEI